MGKFGQFHVLRDHLFLFYTASNEVAIMNVKYRSMWREAAVAYFEVGFYSFPVETETPWNTCQRNGFASR
jgi:hypothetical protein